MDISLMDAFADGSIKLNKTILKTTEIKIPTTAEIK